VAWFWRPFVGGVFAVSMLAQQPPVVVRPDFSGHWAAEPSTEQPKPTIWQDPAHPSVHVVRRPPGPGLGQTFIARQDAAVLVIETSAGGTLQRLTVHLDGSESSDTVGTVETVSKATWQDSTLVILTRGAAVDWGTPGELKRVLRLDADGKLSVETTMQMLSSTTRYRRTDTRYTSPEGHAAPVIAYVK